MTDTNKVVLSLLLFLWIASLFIVRGKFEKPLRFYVLGGHLVAIPWAIQVVVAVGGGNLGNYGSVVYLGQAGFYGSLTVLILNWLRNYSAETYIKRLAYAATVWAAMPLAMMILNSRFEWMSALFLLVGLSVIWAFRWAALRELAEVSKKV